MILSNLVQPADTLPAVLARSKFDELEAELAAAPQVQMPLRHLFTPGLYTREIFIPKGTLCTSRVHKTTHPFVVLKGDISVLVDQVEVARHRAPFLGVTTPGTRRMLFAHEDTVWVTFHVTELTDPDAIAEEITENPRNSLLDFNDPRTRGWSSGVSPSLIAQFPQEEPCHLE